MVTIKDVARAAGVSISTVSYAFNGDHRVKDETRKRILAIAKELNYYPSGAARNLKRKKTNTIGVFVSGFGGPFYNELLDGIHLELTNLGYAIIISSNSSARRLILERQIDAAIIHDVSLDDELLTIQATRDFPIIVLDRHLKGENIYEMVNENEKAAYMLVEHLIDKGYKKIGYLSGVVETYDNLHRFKGFVKAITKHGYSTDYYYKGEFTQESGYKVGCKIAENKEDIDALFCANDEMAIGVMEAFRKHSIRIPEDIAIVGCDDIEVSKYYQPSLTTISYNRRKWGREVANTLVRVLKGEKDIEIKQLIGKLVIRDSA